MNEIWEKVIKIIEPNISSVSFDTWFNNNKLKLIAITDSAFILSAADQVTENFINKRFLPLIETAVENVMGVHFEIIVKIKTDPSLYSLTNENNSSNNSIQNSDDGQMKLNLPNDPVNSYVSSPLNPKYVFENFVVGASNEFAYAVSVAVAEAPGLVYNPLFLYGNVGLGKTHLMHSIAHHILEQNPKAKVIYVSTETFLNELIVAIGNKTTREFKEKYRNGDALLIDDIQFISSKDATQTEFFHTFNAILECNKQIIISSDRPPSEISNLEKRLSTRFASGITADIQPPDVETRTAILKNKAKLDNISVPEEVLAYTAKMISSSIRELEGALTTICAYAKLTKQEITVDLAKIALKDIIRNHEKQELSVEYIQSTVADYFKVSTEDLKSKRRSKNIVYPRHIAMYLCRKLLDCPLTDIGNAFGGKDHSTVINGCENISKGLENNTNPTMVKNVNDITAILSKE